MKNNAEKKLILVIRYSLPLFIIIATILISFYVAHEHEKNIIKEKEYIENQYLKDQKDLIKMDIQRVHNYMKKENELVLDNLKSNLKNKVNNVYRIIESIYENNKDKLSKEEILEQIRFAVNELRFSNGKGYFFIYDLDGTVILNSQFPNLVGKNLWNYKDSKGTLLLQEMNKILKKKDETYYNWYWKDPLKEDSQEYLKVGFFKKIKSLNMFVGTGYYFDDHLTLLKTNMLKHIESLSFKDDRYIFVVDTKGNLLSSKYKDLMYKNVYKTPSLQHLISYFDEIKELAPNEGRYKTYVIPLSDNEEPIEKVSYFSKFESFDWIIGTGFQMSSINKVIKEKQDYLTKKYEKYLSIIFFIGALFVIVILVISYIVSKYIEKSFFKYTTNLENQQKLLLKSQDIASLGNWYLNVDTMKAYWSDSILEIFGVEKRPDTLGPEFLKSIMLEEDWQCFESSMTNAIKNNEEHKCTYRIKKPDGKIVWIECTGEYDKKNNKINGVIQDISARKEIEIEKNKKEQLLYQQSKMAAMGEMIGNIAHQWRQPLSVISTAATGVKLKKDMGILEDEELIKNMDSIFESTQYLSQTIEDFRSFFDSKDKDFKEISLVETMNKTFKLIEAQFNSKDIKIFKDFENIQFISLRNELIQVLINILNNSKDALMEKDGDKFIFVNTKKIDDKIIINIYDNANGIDEKIINRIYEPYFTTKFNSNGTGIGLYMSNEIVRKLLHGEINTTNYEFEYNQKKYKGAKSTIILPVNLQVK